MPDAIASSKLLSTFKIKIEESLSLVPDMVPEDKLEAAQFWNIGSGKMQEIMNESVDVIKDLLQKQTAEILKENGQEPDAKIDKPSNTGIPASSSPVAAGVPTGMSLTQPLQAIPSHPFNFGLPTNAGSIRAIQPSPSPVMLMQPQSSNSRVSTPFVMYLPTQTLLFANASQSVGQNVAPQLRLMAPPHVQMAQKDGRQRIVARKIVLPDQAKRGLKVMPPKKATNRSEDMVRKKLQNKYTNLKKAENATNASAPSTDNDVIVIDLEEEAAAKNTENTDTTKQPTTLKKVFSCDLCDAHYCNKRVFEEHLRTHTGERPFECTQCGKKFNTKRALVKHMISHTGEKPWKCNECGRCFALKKSLGVHIRTHTGEKPYKCNVCGKCFRQSGTLKSHRAIHKKEYCCEHCGEKFLLKSQLIQHMKRYKGLRMYKCNNCAARFRTKEVLERHRMIHTGEKPFLCELCGKTFRQQPTLTAHMNIHYGLKPYRCKYCDKSFADMSTCYKHTRNHRRVAKSDGADAAKDESCSEGQVIVNKQDLDAGEVVEAIAALDAEQNAEENVEDVEQISVIVHTETDEQGEVQEHVVLDLQVETHEDVQLSDVVDVVEHTDIGESEVVVGTTIAWVVCENDETPLEILSS